MDTKELEPRALARARTERVRVVKLAGTNRYLARSRIVEPGSYFELFREALGPHPLHLSRPRVPADVQARHGLAAPPAPRGESMRPYDVTEIYRSITARLTNPPVDDQATIPFTGRGERPCRRLDWRRPACHARRAP